MKVPDKTASLTGRGLAMSSVWMARDVCVCLCFVYFSLLFYIHDAYLSMHLETAMQFINRPTNQSNCELMNLRKSFLPFSICLSSFPRSNFILIFFPEMAERGASESPSDDDEEESASAPTLPPSDEDD